jgi:alpha/beta superfamily hydrolase
MKEQSITFPSGTLALEGMIARVRSDVQRGAVVCHPHPLYGGSMYNNVVESTLQAMWELGWTTLRFNFRGVGRSQGEYAAGSGEADDAAAALRFLAAESGLEMAQLVLAGYSFGAVAAAKAAIRLPALGALLLIALPLGMADENILKQSKSRLLLVAGDRDSYCSPDRLRALAATIGNQVQLQIIKGADHFFAGYESDLTIALETMLRTV